MIQSVTVVNHESKTFEFLLNDIYESGLYISNIEGLGYPSSSISSSETFNTSVSVYGKTTKQPRNIVITFGISNWGASSVEQARHLIYNMFPSDMELYMEFKSDERLYNIRGYVENVTPIIFNSEESVQVSIICPNPYFYSGGKIEITSDDHLANFQFTEWFEQLHVYKHLTKDMYMIVREPISMLYDDHVLNRWVECYSKFKNPTGFEITIERPNLDSFNRVVVEYSEGKIVIGEGDIPLSKLDESENAFVGKSILIVNDLNDQNIYEVDSEGKRTSLLDRSIIDGDFINLKVGRNIISAELFGIFMKEIEERLEKVGTISDDLISSYQYNAWVVHMDRNSYVDEIDMFSNSSDTYLGRLTVTSIDLPQQIDDQYLPPPDITEDGKEISINAYYTMPKFVKDTRVYGIYVTRSKEEQHNVGEIKEGDYFYTIWLKTADAAMNTNVDFKNNTPSDKINSLNVELKDGQRDDLLLQLYANFGGDSGNPPYDPEAGIFIYADEQIKFNHSFYDRLDNPLNKETYVKTYGNINDFKIIARYDEMFDAF